MKADSECSAAIEHTIEDLGWTTSEAAETRAWLIAFAEDWDDPLMDVYDGIDSS